MRKLWVTHKTKRTAEEPVSTSNAGPVPETRQQEQVYRLIRGHTWSESPLNAYPVLTFYVSDREAQERRELLCLMLCLAGEGQCVLSDQDCACCYYENGC